MNPPTSIRIPTKTTTSTSGNEPHGAGGRSSGSARRAARDFGFGFGAAGGDPTSGFAAGLARARRLRRLFFDDELSGGCGA
jgi:hypothetical protein